MRNASLILLLVIASCSSRVRSSRTPDEFEKILSVMKTRQLEDLTRTYGQPTEVAGMASDPSVEVWRYTKARVEAYVEKTTRVVSHMTLFFFEDLDNYVYLKKRFNGHKWIEEALPDDKKSHVVTDRYRVKIPELKMQFEYDNGAPKRKVLWIYFE